ncbi:MAG: ABC transporter permease, partial [Acidobacteriota bacterium]
GKGDLAAGIGAVFGVIGVVARTIMWMARNIVPATFSYEIRQGLANLYRPRNQTAVLLLSLGLGTFLILTLFLIHTALLDKVDALVDENQVNTVVWDIQPDQIDGVRELFHTLELPVERDLPVVPMRISAVKGKTAAELLAEPGRRWAVRWDYSSTYRDQLADSEKVIAGEFVGRVRPGADSVPVSLDQQVAADLGLAVGDELVFDVQGVPVPVTVGSLRRVDWQRRPPNFLVVFPLGVLEEAPQFHVVVSRVESRQASADLQRQLVRRFPNVSVVDLDLVLQTVDSVLDEVSFVVQFMALFSIATGLLVLVAAILSSRFQRIREGVLLRTLGASRAQINKIMAVEYLLLGGLAALTGTILSVAAAWLLARHVFEIALTLRPLPLLAAALAVSGLTVLIGHAQQPRHLPPPAARGAARRYRLARRTLTSHHDQGGGQRLTR